MDVDRDGQRMRLFFDGLERVVITTLFAWLTWRIAGSLSTNAWNLIFLLGEGAVAVMVLLRRSTEQISLKPQDWLIGFAGTSLPMLLIPTDQGIASGVIFLLVGVLLALVAKLSLRRSFGIVAANRGVKASGIYRAVRHPMYLGYFIAYVGTFMLNPSLFNLGLLTLWAGCQIYRIHAEERILMQDPAYQALALQTRYRLLPFVY